MQQTIALDNQIFWFRDISQAKSPADIISPSFYKKLVSQLPKFEAHFEYQFVELTDEIFWDKFVPIYKKYVVSKKTYHLNEEQHYEKVIENLHNNTKGQYTVLFITIKGQPETCVGATLFRVSNKPLLSLSFVNKGYDHTLTKQWKIKMSLDYWSEYLIQQFALDNACVHLFHGKDKHPHENAGLSFFKLRAGAFPLSGLVNQTLTLTRDDLKMTEHTLEALQQNDLLVFFTNPDQEGFFQTTSVFFKESSGKQAQFEEIKGVLTKRNFEVITEIY